jgi:hypothetical protein
MSGLFDDAAASIADVIDNSEHVASPQSCAAGILTPLRFAVQELFEEWLRHEASAHRETGSYFSRFSDLLRNAKERAEMLGLEWRHEEQLTEQLAIEAEL